MNLAAFEPAEQPRAAILDQVHLHAGMAAPVADQKRREQVLDHLRCRADPEDSGFAALELASPLAERLGFGKQSAAAPQQVFALRRQLHAPTDAVEQRHTKSASSAWICRDNAGWLRCKRGGRAGEAARIDDRREGAQVAKVHDATYNIFASIWNQ